MLLVCWLLGLWAGSRPRLRAMGLSQGRRAARSSPMHLWGIGPVAFPPGVLSMARLAAAVCMSVAVLEWQPGAVVGAGWGRLPVGRSPVATWLWLAGTVLGAVVALVAPSLRTACSPLDGTAPAAAAVACVLAAAEAAVALSRGVAALVGLRPYAQRLSSCVAEGGIPPPAVGGICLSVPVPAALCLRRPAVVVVCAVGCVARHLLCGVL